MKYETDIDFNLFFVFSSGSSRPTVVISPTNRGKPLDYFNTPPLDGAESNHSVDDPDMIPDTSHMLKGNSCKHFVT